jgi:hypothetical protein
MLVPIEERFYERFNQMGVSWQGVIVDKYENLIALSFIEFPGCHNTQVAGTTAWTDAINHLDIIWLPALSGKSAF